MCLIKDKEKTLNLPASLSFFRQMPPSFLYFQSCPWPTPKEQLCMCYLNIYMVSSFPIPRLYALFKPICDQFIPFSLVILGCLFGQGHLARTKMRGISGNKEKFRGILEFLPLKQWLTTRVQARHKTFLRRLMWPIKPKQYTPYGLLPYWINENRQILNNRTKERQRY